MALPPDSDTLISPNYQLVIPRKRTSEAVEEIAEEEESMPINFIRLILFYSHIFLDFMIHSNVAFIGEIRLSVELRMVPQMEKRPSTVAKLGYKIERGY
ncbi:hypothetical protein L2E82_35520 [Cichorium intybus]|uniref:Uncharacterized protein n=1 Tax=Cichorium intybus TaxID=13427 RepID=A0ACB9BP05_CICIN|nr:hypothetical protein L2E82_35520 [Cichorium intybus]